MIDLRGLVMPIIRRIGIRKRSGMSDPRMKMSLAVTAVAMIRMQTSSSLGLGCSTSRNSRTSGPPYLGQTIALMGLLQVGSPGEATVWSAGGNLPVEVDAVVRPRDCRVRTLPLRR
jgi:hypothetical protein